MEQPETASLNSTEPGLVSCVTLRQRFIGRFPHARPADALTETEIQQLTSISKIASRPQLVYLAFGAETYHQEAVFSIASALAGMRDTPESALDIQVFSDDPAPYRHLPVRVRRFDAPTRRSWSGPYGYHFRCKQVLVRKVLEECDKAILIDTDTFFQESPLKLFERVQPGKLLCNAFTLRYDACKQTVLYTALAEKLAQRGLADDSMPLLNSGVIGLTREDAGILEHSVELMDEFFPITPGAITLEEFCLAVAAYRKVQVDECPDLIHHYWSRKQLFRAKVRAWLSKHGDNPTSQNGLDDTRKVTSSLPRPPVWQRLMYKGAMFAVPQDQRQFVREVLYGCCDYPNEFDRACSKVWWDKALSNAEQRMDRPLTPEKIKQWLNHWAVRQMLGPQREAVYQHLLQREKNP